MGGITAGCVALWPRLNKVPGSNVTLSAESLNAPHCSPAVSSECSGFLSQFKDQQIGLSTCVSLVIRRRCVPCLLHNPCWDGLWPWAGQAAWKIDGWLEGSFNILNRVVAALWEQRKNLWEFGFSAKWSRESNSWICRILRLGFGEPAGTKSRFVKHDKWWFQSQF